MLNGKNISQGELASNTWHEMPSPAQYIRNSGLSFQITPPPQNVALAHLSHYPHPAMSECWIPPRVHPSSPEANARANAVLSIIGGTAETVGGVLLILVPEPTMVTKIGGSALTLHGVDTTQAAIRQLFSGKPTADLTQTGATWAARSAGFSPKNADRIGVVLDVAVPFAVGAGMIGAERVMAIRAGRIILSEEAVAGKTGRVSLNVEEAEEAMGKEGGHTFERHVNINNSELKARALSLRGKNVIISRFISKEIAEDVLNQAIKANRPAMQKWAANFKFGETTGAFEFSASKSVGIGYVKATDSFQTLNRVRVVLRTAKTGPKIFYVLTVYPIL